MKNEILYGRVSATGQKISGSDFDASYSNQVYQVDFNNLKGKKIASVVATPFGTNATLRLNEVTSTSFNLTIANPNHSLLREDFYFMVVIEND